MSGPLRSLSVSILTAVLLYGPSAALAAPPAAVLDPARTVGLVPHKALYDIKLVAAHNGSQVLNIGGQMYYQWQPGCEAWTTDHRFSLTYEYADAPPMQIASDFTTYESFDGKTLDFSSRRRRDGELFQELRGQAKLSADKTGGITGDAIYKDPPDLSFKLTGNTLFPMTHTLALLKAARNEQKFVNVTVFDGSDDEGPVTVNAFIGRKVDPVAKFQAAATIDRELVNTPAWKVRMAFFPEAQKVEQSDYEMTMTLHENGVISDMQIEYEDFTVRQKLVAIEPIKAEGCDSKRAKDH